MMLNFAGKPDRGDQDNRVYVEDTQALFAAAAEPKELWLIPGAGHHDLFRCEGYEAKVSAFLDPIMSAAMKPADLMIIRKFSKWYFFTTASSADSSVS